MPQRRIRLVALDIDGTLLTVGNDVAPEVLEAAARALAAGSRAVLLTGRSRASSICVAEQFPEGWVVGLGSYDGARCEWLPSGELIREVRMEPEVARETVDIMCDYRMGPALFPGEERGGPVFGLQRQPPPDAWQALNLGRMRLLDEPEVAAMLAEGIVTVSALGTHEVAQACYEELAQRVGDRAAVIVTLSERYGGHFAQVAGKGATKADALRLFAERLGVPLAETLAVGDWMNDLPMIELAGVGVAMAEAPEDVRGAADWVTDGVHEHGVARALERFVLGGADTTA